MRSLQKIDRNIDRYHKLGMALAILGVIIGLLLFAYGAIGYYYIQKNSPSVETWADAQTTNA